MNWHRALSEAGSVESLLAVVNEYVLAYPDEYWSWIPSGARPRLIGTVDELLQWHRRLTEALAAAADPNIRLQDLAVFFVQAAARALELEGQAYPSNEADCGSREAG